MAAPMQLKVGHVGKQPTILDRGPGIGLTDFHGDTIVKKIVKTLTVSVLSSPEIKDISSPLTNASGISCYPKIRTKRVSYDILHNLSTVDLYHDEKKQKRRSATKSLGYFEAEHIISSREDSQGTKYLVKWTGFSSFENTWEPQEHLSQPLLRYFKSPRPQENAIQDCVHRLRVSILDALRHKGPLQTVYLEFRHDVFKYLFNGQGRIAEKKNWRLYEANKFRRCKLPDDWSCIFDIYGDGVRVRFPVKMRKFLTLSPKTYKKVGEAIVEAPRAHIEKISVKFVKISSSCN